MATRRKIKKKTRRTKRKLNKKTTTRKMKNKKLFGGDVELYTNADYRKQFNDTSEAEYLATLLMSPGPDGIKKEIDLSKLTNADAATIIQKLIVAISGKTDKLINLVDLVQLKKNLSNLPQLEKYGPNELYSTKDKEKLQRLLLNCKDIIEQLPVQTPNTPPTQTAA